MLSRKTLVSGGTGYAGSHAWKAVAQAQPVTYDSLSTGHRWGVERDSAAIEYLTGRALLVRAFKRFDLGALMHFAGSAYVGESVRSPLKCLANSDHRLAQLGERWRDNLVRIRTKAHPGGWLAMAAIE